MSLNLTTLPTERPQVSEGLHKCTIISTTLRKSNRTGNTVLNICFKCDEGTFFDSITESEDPRAQYKLARLLTVLDVVKNFKNPEKVELSEIAEHIINRELGVYVNMSREQDGYESRPQVNINGDMFLTPAEYEEVSKIIQEEGVI